MHFTNVSGELLEEKDVPLLLYTKNPSVFPPKDNLEHLKKVMKQIGLRNLLLEKDLLVIIKALETIQVPVLLLKGSHLIQTLYPSGVRFVGDMDLLIKPEDFPKAHKVIQELGYQPWLENFPLWIHLHFSKKLTYERDTSPAIPLDLHFSLGPYPYLGRISSKSLWSKAQTIRLRDIKAHVLCPEHLLIHLCLHLFQHLSEKEQTSGCDAAVLLKQLDTLFPWVSFIEEVKRAGVQKPIYLALRMIQKNYQAIIPDNIFDQLTTLPSGGINNLIFQHSKDLRSQRKKHLLQFLTTPGLLPRLGCAFTIIRRYTPRE